MTAPHRPPVATSATPTLRRGATVAALALAALATGGCASMSERDRNTAVGAAVGGVAGSVLTDGGTFGTLGGAVIGGAIGHGMQTRDDRRHDRKHDRRDRRDRD
jgi:osmotically inducible lipoprotein OsmB